MNKNLQIYYLGIKDAIPIGLGYFAVSFSFGLLAKNFGLTAFKSSLISLTNLTSAGQFAGIEIINKNSPYIEMAISQLIINSRYLLMSSYLSQKIAYNTALPKRLLMAFGITDEIYSLTISNPSKISPYYIYGAMSIAIPCWTLGTLTGVIASNALNPKVASSLNIALYGMLISAIIPSTKNNKIITGIITISMFTSFLLNIVPVVNNFSPGIKIIVLSLLITTFAAKLFPLKEYEDE
ncbi:AzlC family ABC transporter permease [Miniphocaeibacter massiliensis]|uniref:AzlC family ABC transporter permease n=1 Tax=Miniphocaeibacter massiliensis TaxID=2041841 RepID=UPI000C1BF71C|nr:AzlC family ABC transporter permease [Miniphocaeibacter massiliensis]